MHQYDLQLVQLCHQFNFTLPTLNVCATMHIFTPNFIGLIIILIECELVVEPLGSNLDIVLV